MTVTVKHSKTNAISDWTQAQLDEQIALGNFAPGTTLANIVLPSDWNNNHTLTGIGTMAEQNANNVAITGGTINNASIGATTASTGTFTTLIGGNDVANYGQLTGGATTKAIEWKSLGSDSNVAFAIRSKGTGAIDLAAGSSGVNISNGGTVTAITRTATGSLYTGFPSLAITAPTTAGGVQATATPQLVATSTTVISGGTGYTLNDVLTVTTAGGSATINITVTGVSGGVITSASASSAALTSIPSGTVSVSGGTGTGATFTLIYVIAATFTITNAGSGYIEQPTVSFSGGGGSGAAAYAIVGSTTLTRSLGTLMDFYTPAGLSFEVTDSAATPTAYLQAVSGGSGQNGAYIRSNGSATNPNIYFQTKGTGSVGFYSNYQVSAAQQFNITHTASAVNYVQVTGGATGSGPTISTQGSDTNAFLAITSKGTSAIRLQTGGSSQVLINNTTSAINQLGLTGSTTGQACSIITQGTDTNIDLALTPKGTGRVKFGTYTATVTAVAGYIEILDSGGTVRKLAVLT